MTEPKPSFEVVSRGPATERDLFYADWGDELVKKTIPFLNDVLRQMVATSVALAGGSAALLGDASIARELRVAATVAFLFAFAAAFAGMIPYQDVVFRRCVESIEASVERGTRHKTAFITVSAGLTFIGFMIVIIGLISHPVSTP